MRNIPAKVDGVDVLSGDEYNSTQTDLEDFITTSGQTLDAAGGPDTDLEMTAKAAAVYASGGDYYQDSGTANTYVLSRVGNLRNLPSYEDGVQVVFMVGNSNSGASTVNVSGLGAKSITRLNGATLQAGDLQANEYTVLRYDLSNDRFEIQNYSGSRALSVLDGIEVGGNTTGDIVTTDDAQDLTNKTYEGGSVGGNTTGDIVTTDGSQGLTNKTYEGGTVGGNASGDIVTTDGAQTLSGKDFEQNGKVEIRDTGTGSAEEPVQIYAPNTTNYTQLVVGKTGTNGNYSLFGHSYVGDNNGDNYSFLGIGGPTDTEVRVYNNKYVQCNRGYLYINDERDVDNMASLLILAPNLSAGRGLRFNMGVNSDAYNLMLTEFQYNGDGDQSNEIQLGFGGAPNLWRMNAYGNVGMGTAPEGSGGARLNVNGEVQATTLDINGNADISGTLTAGGFDIIPNSTSLTSENAGTVTVTASATSVTTVDLGTVVSGAILMVDGILESVSKGAADGRVTVQVDKSSGTAAVEAYHDRSAVVNRQRWLSGDVFTQSVSGILEVTTGGTLVLRLAAASESSDTTVGAGEGQLRATWLKK